MHRCYQGDGRHNQPYHPTMLVKVLLYAYATGVFSSRKIGAKLIEGVALHVPAAGNRPDFRTINRFRQQHLATFSQLFAAVVRLARKMGLVKLGTVALDGTKVKANASEHRAPSCQRMKEEEQRLEQEIRQWLEQAQQTDQAEDDLCSTYFPGRRRTRVATSFARAKIRMARLHAQKYASARRASRALY